MSRRNRVYSNQLKLDDVQSYLAGEGTMQEIADLYDVRNVSQVKAWLKRYREVSNAEAFNRAPGSGEPGVKNLLKGKRIHFNRLEDITKRRLII